MAGVALATRPARAVHSARVAEIVAAARRVLETEGWDAVTMRRLATEVGMQAPSLYKHVADKGALASALIEDALLEMGEVLHAAVAKPGRRGPVSALLGAYRQHSVANPDVYRLATSGPLTRDALTPGVEEWAGQPFFLATGDAAKAQALWSFAHGMVILEIDGRYPEGSDLDATWRAGGAAFTA
jgi:AcrR family transcriptional regulator